MYHLRIGGSWLRLEHGAVKWTDERDDATSLTLGSVLRYLGQTYDPESALSIMTATILPVAQRQANKLLDKL